MKDMRSAQFLCSKGLEFCRITANDIESKANDAFIKEGEPILSQEEKEVIIGILAIGKLDGVPSSTTIEVSGWKSTELRRRNSDLRSRLFGVMPRLKEKFKGKINSREYYLSIIKESPSVFGKNIESFINRSHPHEEAPKPSRVEVEKLLGESFPKKFEELLQKSSEEDINYMRNRLLAV